MGERDKELVQLRESILIEDIKPWKRVISLGAK